MLKAQKFFLMLGSVVLAALTLVLILENWPTAVTFTFLNQTYPQMSFGSILALSGLLLGFGIACYMWGQMIRLGSSHKKASRELERKDVSREEAESKVKVLESKIETLEKALSEALKSSQPRL